jgi:hypothetical protein
VVKIEPMLLRVGARINNNDDDDDNNNNNNNDDDDEDNVLFYIYDTLCSVVPMKFLNVDTPKHALY